MLSEKKKTLIRRSPMSILQVGSARPEVKLTVKNVSERREERNRGVCICMGGAGPE